MSNITHPFTPTPEITIRSGQAVTTSQSVANFFGKLHKNVIQKIKSLECSPEFMTANFSAVAMKVQAGFDERETEAYEITKNGFVFLVMGFTGKKAAAFKEAYIAEFDRMEAELLSSAVNYQFDGRLLLTVKNGVMVNSSVLRDDQHVMAMDGFFHVARRAGYIIAHIEDLQKLTENPLRVIGDKMSKLSTSNF
ncbi:Rha family transcriptional regulator [Serratia sp. D1N4]